MGTLIISATLILVVMGFSNHVLWLAAVALLFLYVRYGRTGGSASTASPSGSSGTSGSPSGARPAPRAARTPATARTANAVTVRPSGSAATVGSARWRRAARSARSSRSAPEPVGPDRLGSRPSQAWGAPDREPAAQVLLHPQIIGERRLDLQFQRVVAPLALTGQRREG